MPACLAWLGPGQSFYQRTLSSQYRALGLARRRVRGVSRAGKGGYTFSRDVKRQAGSLVVSRPISSRPLDLGRATVSDLRELRGDD